MKNVIFKHKDKATLSYVYLQSNADTVLWNYYSTGDPKFTDSTDFSLQSGDKVYWNNKYSGDKELVGTVSATATVSGRVTLADATDASLYEATQAYGFFECFVIKSSTIVSYPINQFRGARMNDSSNKTIKTEFSTEIVSLYFERGPGYLDEVRLNIIDGSALSFISDFNKLLKSINTNDIVFRDGLYRNISSSLRGVNKILTSISRA